MTKTEYPSPASALAIPEFRFLMTGRFLFIAALRMMGTLLGWWVYELTGDPLAIGLIGLAEVVPAVGLALYAGHVIDISEKKSLLRKGILAYAVCALCLCALAGSSPQTFGGVNSVTAIIYAIVFATGIIRAFIGPLFSTLLASVVPRPLLQNATTWNQGVWLSASVIGHASAGFLIAGLGNAGSLVTVLVLISLGFGLLAPIQKRPPVASNKEKGSWESVKEGLRFVYKTKELLGALTLDLFAVLFGGAVAMIPVFAKDILGTGPIGFGWLNAATDIGAIAVIAWLALFPLQKKQGQTLLLAVGGFGVCILVFALSTWFWLSFAALVLSGILDGISVVIRGTIVQMKTPDAMRGRVMSVNSMFINSSNELGQFESGVAAKLMGVIPSVLFGGTMTLVVVALTWFKAPSLRKMEY
ncbi:MAG: MFS transporter [Sphingobacteriia bacterium]|nr:MAG: MFS transporter [Sphingobacteriia bacterium]